MPQCASNKYSHSLVDVTGKANLGTNKILSGAPGPMCSFCLHLSPRL